MFNVGFFVNSHHNKINTKVAILINFSYFISMCGVFGICTKSSSFFNSKLLEKTITGLFKLSETRGKEASGVAFIANDNIKVLKQATPASELINSQIYRNSISEIIASNKKNSSLTMIGHSRLVTNGSSEMHFNNQPVIADKIVAVHNGIVVNDHKLWTKFPGFKKKYDVDTEIILKLLRHFYQETGSIQKATCLTFMQIQGATSIATLFEDLNCLLLATNNGSLYVCTSEDNKTLIFGSEQYIIDTLIRKNKNLRLVLAGYNLRQISPGTAFILDLNSLNVEEFSLNSDKIYDLKVSNGLALDTCDLLKPSASSFTNIIQNKTELHVPSSFIKFFESRVNEIKNLKRCSRCVLPETMPFISFDSKQICSYCNSYNSHKLYGDRELEKLISKYREQKNTYNCIVSLSGGRDSSYSLHYIKNVLGLNPITYTYDWGMVTDLARRNISRICGKLGVEHILISADIRKKRANIKKNITAWLKKPEIGMIPLFMAGDKQFFYHGNRLKQQLGIELTVMAENLLEKTSFKTGFCGIKPTIASKHTYSLPLTNKLKLLGYYGANFVTNPAYINSSLIDTFLAYCSYYVMSHNFLYLFHYIPWNEQEIEKTLINTYDWETASDTSTTWRIGDGTASFYNYIYYVVAGFTENETFRSNQIREGLITRLQAIDKIFTENQARWESIKWYCDTINIDFQDTLQVIHNIKRHY